MVFSGAALPVAMGHIDDWIATNGIYGVDPASRATTRRRTPP
jgi:hypothetical protein